MSAESQRLYGWALFLVMGLFNAAQGAILVAFGGEAVQESIVNLAGVPWSDLQATTPAVATYVNDLLMIVGLFLAAFGVLVATIAATGYRKRHVWAWYSMWVVPVFYLLAAAIMYAKGEIYYSDDLSFELFAFLLIVSFLALATESKWFRRRDGLLGGR